LPLRLSEAHYLPASPNVTGQSGAGCEKHSLPLHARRESDKLQRNCNATEPLMKTASFPAVRVTPELRQAAEDILQEDETLSGFVEQSIREGIERRQFAQAFIARGLRSRETAQQSGRYASAETLIERLEQMLSAAKAGQ
jgi:predicted transcriptional regulator